MDKGAEKIKVMLEMFVWSLARFPQFDKYTSPLSILRTGGGSSSALPFSRITALPQETDRIEASVSWNE